MTTWSNTFTILCYNNYYLRNVPFKRNAVGLIEPSKLGAVFISGDDHLIFVAPHLVTLAYEEFSRHVAENRANNMLGRVCDPINVTEPGKLFGFISRYYRIT